MGDSFIPPPSYQLSQQGRDEKITEKFNELISSKISIQDVEEERDGDDTKDSKEPDKQLSLFSDPVQVQPLRIRKRPPRGARPLPLSPADVQSRSRPAAVLPTAPSRGEADLQGHQVLLSPPPPFTVVDPSLNASPYERSLHHASSSAPSPISNSTPTHMHPSSVRRGQQRPSSSYSPAQSHADSYRRISHNPFIGASSSSQNILPITRLKFDPSIAYGTSSNVMRDFVEYPSDTTPVNANLLYSSAMSPYLNPAPAGNPSPHSSYIARNRYTTSPRPSSSSALIPSGGSTTPVFPFHSSPVPEFSASQQSLGRSRLTQEDHGRWATSEAEFTRDIYP